MERKGWVKLHRKVLENIFLMKDDTAFVLFMKLLLLSNSKGQVGYSTRDLAERVNMKHGTLYKTLKRLEREKLISQTGKHSFTLISICNWEKYQSGDPKGKQQNSTFGHFGKQFGKQSVTESNSFSGKQAGKHTVNAGETHGKRLTGVARIENKELRNSNDFEKGKGYKKAKAIRDKLVKQKSLPGIRAV